MNFAQFLQQTDSWKVFLVDLNPAAEVETRVWAQHGVYTSCWWCAFTDGVVNRVSDNTIEYIEAYSLIECEATANSFWYDFTNQKLYVHDHDGGDPSVQTVPDIYDHIIIAYFWRYFSNTHYEDEEIVFPRITEALLDGRFEQWTDALTPTKWTGSASGTSSVNREGSTQYEGAYCVRLDIDGSNSVAYVWQAFRLVPGAPCTITLWYKHTGSADSDIEFYDSGSNVWLKSDGTWAASQQYIHLANSTTWAKLELSFTAHASYTNYKMYLVRGAATSASCYFDSASIEIEREEHPYTPTILSAGMADLQQAVADFHTGGMTMECGSMQFLNEEGWWYNQVASYYWFMKDIVIRYGAKGSARTEYEKVFDGMIRQPKVNDLVASVDVIDKKVYGYTNVPTQTYDVATFTWLESGAEGQPIPIIYGEFAEVVPTCINTSSGTVDGIPAYTFQLACHALEAIPAVYKNGALQTVNVDYTVDLTNARITMLADPGQAFIVCQVKGRKCDIVTGAYSENVADILYDLLVTYGAVDPEEMDLVSFLDLKASRSQKHHLYIGQGSSTPILEVARTLQASALFHLIPMSTGRLGAFRYKEGVDSTTPRFVDEDYSGFEVNSDTEGVFKTVQVLYGYLPSESHYDVTETTTDAVEWRHGNKETLPITSSLRLLADAEELKAYYTSVVGAPLKKITTMLPSQVFSLRPGEKVILNKTRPDERGNPVVVLSEEPYRLIELRKKMQTGKVEVVAWEDLQSSGSTFCEVCYHCETCVITQGGSCTVCYVCQMAYGSTCNSCQDCYYCQLCDTSQCSSCQTCDTCQSCDTCQNAVGGICQTCQMCFTGQCQTCQHCVSCMHCDACQRESCGKVG